MGFSNFSFSDLAKGTANLVFSYPLINSYAHKTPLPV